MTPYLLQFVNMSLLSGVFPPSHENSSHYTTPEEQYRLISHE